MLVAVLSDIHSNAFALSVVLQDAERIGVGELWVGGDTFGYYPWAAETFRLIGTVEPVGVLGNHDRWVLDADLAPGNIAGEVARRNASDLATHNPLGLDWLASLAPVTKFERSGWKITIAHGTPEDPLEGRYYPDDVQPYDWLPQKGEILILGQTHYPIVRGCARDGLLLNPGSVGQSRDGNAMPSWALLDLATGSAELRRTVYDSGTVTAALRELHWDERLTHALERP